MTQNLLELQKVGLVRDSGSIGNTGGRRARVFSVVKDAKLSIGLDIDKTGVTAVLVDLKGNIVCKEQKYIGFSQSDSYYRQIGEIVLQLIESAHVPADKILGVGIGVPGLVTEDRERVFYGKILDFDGAICRDFSRYIPFPCRFYNDAKAAGAAELWNRADLNNAFYVLLSDHVGGAVIHNHTVDLGEHTRAGEIGHLTIVPFGKRCYCGRMGCVESYCSASVLAEKASGSLEGFFIF